MKKLYAFLIGACLFITAAQNAFAQTPPTSPMAGMVGRTANAYKFFGIMEQWDPNGTNNSSRLSSLFGKMGASGIDTMGSKKYDDVGAKMTFNTQLGAASGDMDGDAYDDNATLSMSNNGYIYISLAFTGTSALETWGVFGFELPYRPSTISAGTQSRLNIAMGDLDGNKKDDVTMQWVDSITKQIKMLTLEWVGGSFNPPRIVDSVTVPLDNTLATLALSNAKNAVHITSADLDDDGNEELIIGYIAHVAQVPNFYIAIYDLVNGKLVYKGNELVVANTDADNCSVAAGYFSGTNKKDIAFALGRSSSGIGTSWVGLTKVDLTQGATDIITPVGTPLTFQVVGNETGRCNIAAGDLNGDHTDEVVFAAGPVLKIIKVTNGGTTYQNTIAANSGIIKNTVRYANSGLAVGDANRDGKAEIFVISSSFAYVDLYETICWQVLKTNASVDSVSEVTRKDVNFWDNNIPGATPFSPVSVYPARRCVALLGNYDGKQFSVGEGIMYKKPNVVQPLVILNAPPIHFDILDSSVYDVSQCYNGGGCTFSSTYFTALSTQVDVSTEVTSDWAVSGTLSAGGSFGIVEVGAYMSASYGEQYAKVNGASTTISISSQASATADDYIYAAVSDYYVWEYPVYRNGTFMGYIASVTPQMTAHQWFPSKGWDAFTYIPNHEVGCILSYKDYPSLNNPDIDQKIKGSYIGNSFTLSANNGFSWSLLQSEVISNGASTQKDIGVEVGANAGIGGISVETSAGYNKSDLTTYSTTLTTDLELTMDVSSGLDISIGEVNYTITPYTYWSKNGALVLDYAAKPEKPISGGTPTWWLDNYSVQDPAFIMPWRYDPEKGYNIPEQKRRQSKSISFYPYEASIGDTITITTSIYNFSLEPTGDSIKVQFYIGDPLMGDMITDINGNSEFVLPSLDARDRYTLPIEWKVPAGIYKTPKIYAVIDPENTITEIHRNNDVGFNVFSVNDGVLVDPDTIGQEIETGITELPAGMRLMHTYPNPFSTNMLFEYNVINDGAVQMNIYDLDGRLVATPINTHQSRGMYSASYNGTALSKGIYTYRFTSGSHIETGKLVKF